MARGRPDPKVRPHAYREDWIDLLFSWVKYFFVGDLWWRRFEDMQRRVPDTTKLRDLTGWAPTRSLDDILSDSIAEARLQPQRAVFTIRKTCFLLESDFPTLPSTIRP